MKTLTVQVKETVVRGIQVSVEVEDDFDETNPENVEEAVRVKTFEQVNEEGWDWEEGLEYSFEVIRDDETGQFE